MSDFRESMARPALMVALALGVAAFGLWQGIRQRRDLHPDVGAHPGQSGVPSANRETSFPDSDPRLGVPGLKRSGSAPPRVAAPSDLRISQLGKDEWIKQREGAVGFNAPAYGATLSARSVEVASPFAIRGLGRPRLAWTFEEARVGDDLLALGARVEPVFESADRSIAYSIRKVSSRPS
jgi:hypothetical protein